MEGARAAPGGGHLLGIRHIIHDEADPDWLDRADVNAGLVEVFSAGLSYDLLLKPPNIASATRCVAAHPGGRFIVDHGANPRIGDGVAFDVEWSDAMAPLAALPNTWCKLSGLVTEADWHGWQEDLEASIQNSFVSTMQGSAASQEDVAVLRDYLASLESPRSPFTNRDGSLSEAALRGQQLFQDSKVGCSECHAGERFTDGQNHDVGMARDTDKYRGYNTPSLIGVYRKIRLLHDGRAKSLEDVLTKWHSPEQTTAGDRLSEEQLADLVAYLKSL